jgi:tripartite-type tricarboxylate transporter receptor subunit TctC
VAPAATPAAVIQILNEQVNAALKSPELSQRLQGEGAIPMGGSSQEMRKYLEQNLTMWEKVVKESGAKAD